MAQMMSNMSDEIQRLTAKLAKYKELYYVQQQEREMAGQRYTEISEELDKNKQVLYTSSLPTVRSASIVSQHVTAVDFL